MAFTGFGKKKKDRFDKKRDQQTIGDMLREQKKNQPTIDDPYGLRNNVHTPYTDYAEELRIREQLGNQIKETYDGKIQKAMNDAINTGGGMYEQEFLQPLNHDDPYDQLRQIDKTIKRKRPTTTTITAPEINHDALYDMYEQQRTLQDAFQTTTTELKMPFKDMSHEEMLVKLFTEEPALIETLSFIADDEKVLTMDIIIFILQDYLTPIEHT